MIRKDDLAGVLIAAIGLAAVLIAGDYNVGSVESVGPGFLPRVIGIGLIVAGLIIIVLHRITGPADGDSLPTVFARMSPRGWVCILGAMALFPTIAGYFGLAPAAFVSVFIAALGDRENTKLHAAVLATGLTAAASVVFWWALGLQIPLLQWGG